MSGGNVVLLVRAARETTLSQWTVKCVRRLVQVSHADLEIEHRLCGHAWYRGAADVIRPQRERPERLSQLVSPGLASLQPRRVVRPNLGAQR